MKTEGCSPLEKSAPAISESNRHQLSDVEKSHFREQLDQVERNYRGNGSSGKKEVIQFPMYLSVPWLPGQMWMAREALFQVPSPLTGSVKKLAETIFEWLENNQEIWRGAGSAKLDIYMASLGSFEVQVSFGSEGHLSVTLISNLESALNVVSKHVDKLENRLQTLDLVREVAVSIEKRDERQHGHRQSESDDDVDSEDKEPPVS